MSFTEMEKDRFCSEVALTRGVDLDRLLEMPAAKYSDVLRNADEIMTNDRREQNAKWDGQHFI